MLCQRANLLPRSALARIDWVEVEESLVQLWVVGRFSCHFSKVSQIFEDFQAIHFAARRSSVLRLFVEVVSFVSLLFSSLLRSLLADLLHMEYETHLLRFAFAKRWYFRVSFFYIDIRKGNSDSWSQIKFGWVLMFASLVKCCFCYVLICSFVSPLVAVASRWWWR